MEDQKTISVTHYLNKRVKPQMIDEVEHYPVYTQVTYDGNNTQFHLNFCRALSEKEFESFPHVKNLETGYIDNLISTQVEIEQMIHRIIRFEVKYKGDRFHLRGFYKRLPFYNQDFFQFLNEEVFNGMLLRALEEELTLLHWREIAEAGDTNFTGCLDYISQLDINKESEGFQKVIHYSSILAYLHFYIKYMRKGEGIMIHQWLDENIRTQIRFFIEKSTKEEKISEELKNDFRNTMIFQSASFHLLERILDTALSKLLPAYEKNNEQKFDFFRLNSYFWE